MYISKHLTLKVWIVGFIIMCWIIGAIRYALQLISGL